MPALAQERQELYYLGFDGRVYAVPLDFRAAAESTPGNRSRFSRSTPKPAPPFTRLSRSTFPPMAAAS